MIRDISDVLWSAVEPQLRDIVSDLRKTNPQLWADVGHASNDAFPFWAYISFGKSGKVGIEDIVISMSFKQSSSSIEFSSDIARGDGMILKEGPTSHAPTSEIVRARHWAESCTATALDFFRQNLILLHSELATGSFG